MGHINHTYDLARPTSYFTQKLSKNRTTNHKKRQESKNTTSLINRCLADSREAAIPLQTPDFWSTVYIEIHLLHPLRTITTSSAFPSAGHELHIVSATACCKLCRTNSKLYRCLFDAFALRPAVRVGLGQNPKPERGGLSVKDSDQMTVCAEHPAGQDAPVRPPVGLQANRQGAGGDSPRAALAASS